jgi:hypothetical protein
LKPGEIIFPSDFRGVGSQVAIKQALSRLTRTGKVRRLGHGIYYIPKRDPVLGEVRPAADDVVNRLAQKEHVRIRPAGAYALHRLGLSTQVPTKLVYFTDGNSKRFRLGKMEVRFKPTSPKKMSIKGELSGLVIQALEELGTSSITSDVEKKLAEFLLKEDPKILRHDLALATVKINDYIVRLLKKTAVRDDQLASTNR